MPRLEDPSIRETGAFQLYGVRVKSPLGGACDAKLVLQGSDKSVS